MHTLSESALSLLRGYRGDIMVVDSNRDPCRELAAAGFLIVGHSFVGGREHFYRLTEMGLKLKCIMERMDHQTTSPSLEGFASPRP